MYTKNASSASLFIKWICSLLFVIVITKRNPMGLTVCIILHSQSNIQMISPGAFDHSMQSTHGNGAKPPTFYKIQISKAFYLIMNCKNWFCFVSFDIEAVLTIFEFLPYSTHLSVLKKDFIVGLTIYFLITINDTWPEWTYCIGILFILETYKSSKPFAHF